MCVKVHYCFIINQHHENAGIIGCVKQFGMSVWNVDKGSVRNLRLGDNMGDYVKTLEDYIYEEERERRGEIKNKDREQAMYCGGIIAGLMLAIYEYKRRGMSNVENN